MTHFLKCISFELKAHCFQNRAVSMHNNCSDLYLFIKDFLIQNQCHIICILQFYQNCVFCNLWWKIKFNNYITIQYRKLINACNSTTTIFVQIWLKYSQLTLSTINGIDLMPKRKFLTIWKGTDLLREKRKCTMYGIYVKDETFIKW